MKLFSFVLVFLLAACASVPTKESGVGKIEIRSFFQGQQQLSVRVSKIVDVSNTPVFQFENKAFGANAVNLPAGEYTVTFACRQETGAFTTSAGIAQHPEYSEKLHLQSGESLRLGYEYVHTLQYGNHCKPHFITNMPD